MDPDGSYQSDLPIFLKNIFNGELTLMKTRQKSFFISIRSLYQTIVGPTLNETID